MSDGLKHQVLDYLQSHNTMTLATSASDVPWAATVFYASDDLRVYFFSAPDSRHCQNLSVEKAKAMTIYARKYPDVIKLFTDPASGAFYKAFLKVKFYCVVPEKLFYIDNEQGFGKRRELALDAERG